MRLIQLIAIALLISGSSFVFSSDQLQKKNDWLDRTLLRMSKKTLKSDLRGQSVQYSANISDNEGDSLHIQEEKRAARRMFAVIGAYEGAQRVSAELQLNAMHVDMKTDSGRAFVRERLRGEINKFKA